MITFHFLPLPVLPICRRQRKVNLPIAGGKGNYRQNGMYSAMLLEDGIHIVYLKNCTIFEVSATKNLMRMPILKRNFLGFFYCISQKVN